MKSITVKKHNKIILKINIDENNNYIGSLLSDFGFIWTDTEQPGLLIQRIFKSEIKEETLKKLYEVVSENDIKKWILSDIEGLIYGVYDNKFWDFGDIPDDIEDYINNEFGFSWYINFDKLYNDLINDEHLIENIKEIIEKNNIETAISKIDFFVNESLLDKIKQNIEIV